jgi:adenosylmethionine---8-amino-7-oxononanoate aminotransferase
MEPEWLSHGARHVWRPYYHHKTAPAPLAVVDAQGSWLKLADGRRLLDGTASWWTAAHGYRHPHVEQAVAAQLKKLPHIAFGGMAHEAGYTLASRLAQWLYTAGAPELERVFFVESGSVAVEVATKMCLQAQLGWHRQHRTKVLSFFGGYHGDTFATMAMCDPVDGMHADLSSWRSPQVEHLAVPQSRRDYDDFDQRFEALAPTLAAVIIEPLLQAAGGMRIHSSSFLVRLRELCDQHGVLLILDEIATGFYRTGTRFAFAQAAIVPDVIVLGKALSAGTLPLACAVTTQAVFNAVEEAGALQHGPTYMANALACAAGHASLDVFENGGAAADHDRSRPLEHAGHRIRSLGVMVALDLAPGTAPSSAAFAAHDVFVRPLRLPHADVVYLMPSLSMSEVEATALTRAVVAVVGDAPPHAEPVA